MVPHSGLKFFTGSNSFGAISLKGQVGVGVTIHLLPVLDAGKVALVAHPTM